MISKKIVASSALRDPQPLSGSASIQTLEQVVRWGANEQLGPPVSVTKPGRTAELSGDICAGEADLRDRRERPEQLHEASPPLRHADRNGSACPASVTLRAWTASHGLVPARHPEDDGAPPARAVLVDPDGRRPVRVRTRAAGRTGARLAGRKRASSARSSTGSATLLLPRRRSPGARCCVGNAHVRLVSFGGGAILGERPLAADGIEPPATVDSYWGDGYAVARAEQRFIAGDPQPTSDFRQVSSPLTDEMLRPALTGRGVVQFDRRLTDDDFRKLGEWFRAYPEMDLRAYGSYDHSITDLEFLRFFPTLRRFAADALWDSLTSLDGLRHLPTDLEELGIGATKAKLDLAVLVSLSGAAMALPRGSDEAPRGDLGTDAARRPDAAIDHDARPLAPAPVDAASIVGPQARRDARPPTAAARRRAVVPGALDDPRTDGRDGRRRDPVAPCALPAGAASGRGASGPEGGDVAAPASGSRR